MTRTTASFNAWICENASRLRENLGLYSSLDEDAFQDAYLTLATAYNKADSGAEFEKAFVTEYRKFSRKNIGEAFTTVHPKELFFTLLPAEDPEDKQEADAPSRWLISRIRKHIRDTFPKTDVLAFEMKVAGYSCRDITDTIGIGTTAINNAANRIAMQTRLKFASVAL